MMLPRFQRLLVVVLRLCEWYIRDAMHIEEIPVSLCCRSSALVYGIAQ
jgi:hypothetical protein